MSFSALKSKRRSVEDLQNKAEEAAGDRKSYGDDRYWKPTVDKAGNAAAVIRFLPAKADEDLPWVQYWSHGFKGPTGRWYIENSLTTLGQDDPVGEANAALWNSGIESDKEIARKRKRKLSYVSNIYVVNDPANPDNNGKVFLFRYGKKLFEKIKDQMKPDPIDQRPAIDPFDFWNGCDFKLRQQKVEGYPNYDKSVFADQKALSDDDAELESIYGQMHSLSEIVAPSQFKSYAELKRKFMQVMGEDGFKEDSRPASKEAETPRSSESKVDLGLDKDEDEDSDTDTSVEDFFKRMNAS